MPRRATRTHRLLALMAVALCVGLLASCGSGGDGTSEVEPGAATGGGGSHRGGGEPVEFTTDDGIVIKGTLTAARRSNAPAVVLVHPFGGARDDWARLVPELHRRSLTTLAYDIRGMGQSTTRADGADYAPPRRKRYLKSMALDAKAAVDHLREQLRSRAIGIVGAGGGARVAFVASGSDLGISGAVVLSPPASGAAIPGRSVRGFEPRGVLGVAGRRGAPAARRLARRAAAPKRVLETRASSHGVGLLEVEPVREAVVDWLERRLR